MAKKAAIIVESPTKTRTLSRFLGDEYILLASKGHVRDLPEATPLDEQCPQCGGQLCERYSRRRIFAGCENYPKCKYARHLRERNLTEEILSDQVLGVDIQNSFKPHYVIIPGQRKVLEQLSKQLADVDHVYLASDPDREGEAIAWHLTEALGLSDVKRIQFNEITEEAVRGALQSPGEIDLDRVNAQQARRVLDRLVGYKLGPLLCRNIGGRGRQEVLSAGRVQSVALRLICDREREVAAFEPEEYWTIEAHLTPDEETPPFIADLKTKDDEEVELANEEQAQAAVGDLRRQRFLVAEVEHKTRRRNAQPPFITSTLQRQAAYDLHFSARKTMQIAQQLYEGVETDEDTVGLITYMRTDSTRVAKPAQNQARKYIREHFGNEYVGKGARGKKVKAAQEAHECIRPTSVFREPDKMKEFLDKDQAALYELIWRRFVASQMTPAVYDQYAVDISAGPYGLRASTSAVKFPGFLRVLPDKKDKEEGQLPVLEVGHELQLVDLDPQQHFTQPPPRYNEGTLVQALEENGIGRPSTYAPTIETLRQRRYVRMQKRAFLPTALGLAVNDYLVERFPNIMDVEFTARVEEDLDTVERGEREWVDVLRAFYPDFEASLQQAAEAGPKLLEGEKCPECGGELYEKYSAYGKFAGCENYPDCTYKRDLLEDVLGKKQPAETTGEKCPECSAELVKRTSRRGQQFIGCSGYPECRYTRPLRGTGGRRTAKEAIPTDIECPDCGQNLVLRYGRRGPFLGCAAYPKCKFTRNVTEEELQDIQAVGSNTAQVHPKGSSDGTD